jgi:hypothetical protein
MTTLTMTELMSTVRKRHFKQLIEYAMERVAMGGQRASQRQLAEKLMLAPGMIRRYLDMETSVEGLKFTTLSQLARACRLHVGTVFVWIEEGRDQAMTHELSLGGNTPPFGALDLARRLVEILEGRDDPGGDGGEDHGPDVPPPPDLTPLRQRTTVFAEEAGDLMGRMVRMVGAGIAMAKLENSELAVDALDPSDWLAMAALLEVDAEALRLECGVARTVA